MTKNTKLPKLAGRPPKLSNKIIKQTKEIMARGCSKNTAIRELGISRSTFYKWQRENQDFANAVADGLTYGESVHEEIIKGMAQGSIKGGSVAAYQMYMRNVHGWDRNQGDGNTHNTQININSMNVLQDKSTEDLLEYIRDMQDEIKPMLEADIIDVEVNDE